MAVFDGMLGPSGATSARQQSSNNYDEYLNTLINISNNNNHISQQNAREQMAFQASQSLQTQKFNSAEAEKTRKWQEYMSNSAHQREVNDLIKAGLNPVLSANHGGASTPTGASASASGVPTGAKGDVDTSLVSALANLLSSTMNSAMSFASAQYTADKSYESSKYSSDKSFRSSMYGHDLQYKASKYSSDQSLKGSVKNANSNTFGHVMDFFGDVFKALVGVLS